MSNKIPDSYGLSSTVSAMQAAAAANGGTDNKTLVCLFFYGAADSHNMLIPHTDAAATSIPASVSQRRTQYETARPVPTVGVANNTLLKVPPRLGNGTLSTNPNEVAWGLHPNLTNLAGYYNGTNGAVRAAALRSVGVLDKPLTKEEYINDPKSRPDQLFAHNIQQELWMSALAPDTLRTSGWFGRAMNLMDPYFNATQAVRLGSFNVNGTHLQGRGYSDLLASAVPASTIQVGDGRGTSGANGWGTIRDGLRGSGVNYATSRNLLHRSFVNLFNSAVTEQAALSTALQTLPTAQNNLFTNLPQVNSRNNPMRDPLRTAARVIYSRAQNQLAQRRQVITIGWGGWDHHSALRTNQDPMLTFLDQGIQAFWQALTELGLANSVVLFTESEFGRTFQSNGTLGTDHAWAGHSFITGPSVRAGLYGPEPNYTVGGDRDTGQGRFIPDVSIEEYYSTLLKWFGIPESLMHLVLPNINAFPSKDLGFLTN